MKDNLLVSQEQVAYGSSCDSLCHKHHKITSGPTIASSTSFTQLSATDTWSVSELHE